MVNDMIHDEPKKRPDMNQVVERFQTIRADLGTLKLCSGIVPLGEPVITKVFRAVPRMTQTFLYIIRGHPAIPSRSTLPDPLPIADQP